MNTYATSKPLSEEAIIRANIARAMKPFRKTPVHRVVVNYSGDGGINSIEFLDANDDHVPLSDMPPGMPQTECTYVNPCHRHFGKNSLRCRIRA